jgi:putative oxidoreductase
MIKKLLNTRVSNGAFNTAMLVLRIMAGGMMIVHGYDKLLHFAEYKAKFMSFLGLGSGLSLSLAIFAEFFCALFMVLGLFTRVSAIPLIISCSVALFSAHHADVLGAGEKIALYLGCFITLFIAGPGKISVDGMIGK